MTLRLFLLGAILFLAACARQAPTPDRATDSTIVVSPPTLTAIVTPQASAVIPTIPAPDTPTAPATLLPRPPSTPPIVETATIAASSTTDPYARFTIEGLAARSYGGGELNMVETIHVTESFTRTLVSYESDGLTVYGFMNVPFGSGPFPVALVLHGYIPPRQYGTIGYTTRYADILARNGYLVLHPNYRNHPPSDETEAFAAGRSDGDFRIGYAVDVLSLIAIVRQHAGRAGPLANADPQEMHLLGHSMGGGIALRIVTVDPEINAAVLYGSMSGDEAQNFERIQLWSNGETGAEELTTPPEVLERISPVYHLSRIQAAVSIHHGDLDDIVPPEWSVELCAQLQDLGKEVECFSYPGAPHSFHDEVDYLFQQRVLDFFARY